MEHQVCKNKHKAPPQELAPKKMDKQVHLTN